MLHLVVSNVILQLFEDIRRLGIELVLFVLRTGRHISALAAGRVFALLDLLFRVFCAQLRSWPRGGQTHAGLSWNILEHDFHGHPNT